mgnify:FL=1
MSPIPGPDFVAFIALTALAFLLAVTARAIADRVVRGNGLVLIVTLILSAAGAGTAGVVAARPFDDRTAPVIDEVQRTYGLRLTADEARDLNYPAIAPFGASKKVLLGSTTVARTGEHIGLLWNGEELLLVEMDRGTPGTEYTKADRADGRLRWKVGTPAPRMDAP